MQLGHTFNEFISIKFFHSTTRQHPVSRQLNNVQNSQEKILDVSLTWRELAKLMIAMCGLGVLVAWGIEILALALFSSGL